MFVVMKDIDYAAKPKFIEKFWHDWRKVLGTKNVIKNFGLCDLSPFMIGISGKNRRRNK